MDRMIASIDALADAIMLATTTVNEAAERLARVAELSSYFLGTQRVKHRHPRHKQIERARAMMERGQKGK